MISRDPLKGIRLKKPKPRPQPWWTRKQVDQIVRASDKPQRDVFRVLAETGMRIGELKHLTWDDVEFESGVLFVRPKDGWQPKSGDQRAIPMTPVVREVLSQRPRDARWVFTAPRSRQYPDGKHFVSERRLLAYLKSVLKQLKLPGHLHTFRHSFISHALTSGVPEAIVQHWVGHVDREVLNLYTHIADSASCEAMQRLAGVNGNHGSAQIQRG
jgi:integrase